jgi:hypothetical protein
MTNPSDRRRRLACRETWQAAGLPSISSMSPPRTVASSKPCIRLWRRGQRGRQPSACQALVHRSVDGRRRSKVHEGCAGNSRSSMRCDVTSEVARGPAGRQVDNGRGIARSHVGREGRQIRTDGLDSRCMAGVGVAERPTRLCSQLDSAVAPTSVSGCATDNSALSSAHIAGVAPSTRRPPPLIGRSKSRPRTT